jgi:putative spermidine/putrescine transport system substrate-binding protein/spermidine/putrescine transport system substrate-binding protein
VPTASGPIDFIYWEGYDFPKAMKAWKKEHGVTVRATYMGSMEDIPAKLKGGGAEGYDLIGYGSSYKQLFAELGLLQPIDESKLPNITNLLPFFASDVDNIWVDADGTRTGVPIDWGAIGISYDEDIVKEAPTSYDILFEPQYKGKVAMPDDALGVYGQAAQVLGLNSATMTESQFQQVTDWLSDLAKQTSGVSPSYGDVSTRLIAGDAVLAFAGWAAYNQFAQDAGKDTIKTVWPDDGGGLAFSDAWAIPPGADNVDTAYAWVNECLTPEIQAKMGESLVGGVVVDGATDLMDPTTASLYPYDDLEAFFEKAPLQQDPPIKSDQYVTRDKVLAAWQEVKAGA